MTSRILFVCLGNICRSPAAEGVFRALAPGMEIDSCGTGDWHLGAPPYTPMQEAATARGYDLSDLRARQFGPGDFHRFDLIIAMDAQNLSDIEAQRPSDSDTPVKLFTDFAPGAGMDHVPDPYFTRDFDGALDLIEEAAQGLHQAISRH
jgi:protein-tyrosine phosphatase